MSLRRALPNFQHLMTQLEDSVSGMLSRMPTSMLSPTSASVVESGGGFALNMPATDLRETDQAYVIETEVPGVPKENLSMELVNERTLRLSGHYESRAGDRDAGYWAKERLAGQSQRTFSFPSKIDAERIQAHLGHGVLKVEVAKDAQAAENKVPIRIQ